MIEALKWIGTVAGIAGALIVALNLPWSGWGFVVFLASSTCWLTAGLLTGDTPLALLSAAYTGVNVLGIWRWLGRRRPPAPPGPGKSPS